VPPKSISILHESLYSFPECRMSVPPTLTVNEKLLETRIGAIGTHGAGHGKRKK